MTEYFDYSMYETLCELFKNSDIIGNVAFTGRNNADLSQSGVSQ